MPEPDKKENETLKICIIGGGPSGLCTLRHILSSSLTTAKNISVSLFEQQSDVGGVWNYNDPVVRIWDCNCRPVTFPMYNDLTCNLPKQLMEFTDFKHSSDSTTTFLTQKEVHDYLVAYAEKFKLWSYINVCQKIVNATPIPVGNKPIKENSNECKWLVTVEHTKTYQQEVFQFDFVVCCVGVNFTPKIPLLPGIKFFHGDVLHSKFFKTVDEFSHKRIVLLGLGPSSADICLKLSTVANEVVVCHRNPGGFCLGLLPPNVRETSTIKWVNKDSIITEDGEEIPCDVIIYCTGYQPKFPFLDIINNGSGDTTVNSLYKRMFLPTYPSFCFINAHGFVTEFLVMEIQAKYFVSMLEGKINLPSSTIMKRHAAYENMFLNGQGKLTQSLKQGDNNAVAEVEQYLLELANDGGFSPEFKHISLNLAIWQLVIRRIFGSLVVYRQDRLKCIGPNTYKYICAVDDNTQTEVGATTVSTTETVVTFRLNKEDDTVTIEEGNGN